MSRLATFLIAVLDAIRALFSPASPPDPLAPRDPGTPAAAVAGDIEILGLFRHYSAKEIEACIPYDEIDPNVYPDVWVVGRELRRDAHYLIGLEVDGYTVPLADVQSVNSPEHSDDLRIAIIRYPRYDRYRRPGEHLVNVLIGEPTPDGRGAVWSRKIPYIVQTVVRK
jgi:hypothetical protein